MKNYTVVPFDTVNNELLTIGYIYQPEGEGPFDCAIICHGVYDDLNNNTDIAESLASQGMIVINFDYNNESDSTQSDTKITDKIVLAELKDLEAVLEKAKQISNLKNIYLIGINQGATISAMAAQKEGNDVAKLVLLYPVFNQDNLKQIEGYKNPTLIFYGKNDSEDSVEYLKKAAEVYSNCNLIQVENTSGDQSSKSTIKDISEFLSK